MFCMHVIASEHVHYNSICTLIYGPYTQGAVVHAKKKYRLALLTPYVLTFLCCHRDDWHQQKHFQFPTPTLLIKERFLHKRKYNLGINHPIPFALSRERQPSFKPSWLLYSRGYHKTGFNKLQKCTGSVLLCIAKCTKIFWGCV